MNTMSSTNNAMPSSSSLQLIIDALGDYTQITGIDLSKSPFAEKLQLSDSPSAIIELLQEREKAFKEYRDGNRSLMTCLSPAVQILHAFSGTLGEAISLVPFAPAKAIFVGIDVLLTAASGVSTSYDALIDLFECMGNFLKRLEIYTRIPPTPIMTDIVVKILVELLLVLALATKQIQQGRFKKFARKLFGESEVESVLQRLDRLTQDEARMTIAQTLGVVHGLVNNMRVVMEDGRTSTDSIRQDLAALHRMEHKINETKRDQLHRDVHGWLSPPDPSTNHNFVWKAHHSGTAEWFFKSNVLREWKATGSLLWIHGKPGSGKSTLLSAIIQDIEGMRAAGLATMVYYYFDFRDVKKQDLYGLLSSLLSQLSAESDSCYSDLSQLLSENHSGTRKPSIGTLTKCMKDMLNLPGQGRIYIIIDALDECPDVSGTQSAREEVLGFVEELVDLKLPNVHLCVTSRPEIDIRRVLQPLTTLQISLHDESGQKNDIVEYIKAVVHSDRKMRNWREEDKQLVIDILSAKSDGMFRWVVCQIERLRRSFPASIRTTLDDLPRSLDETYGRTLLGIDEEKREYAQRLFRCLTVSIRPLRVDELADILAVRFDTANPTFDANWRPIDAEEALLSACSSLIAIVDVNGSQIVQFSHFSVKEFLTSERLGTTEERLSYYHILPESAHTTLAHACLSVLLQLDDKVDRDIIRHFPLSPYASRHWTSHAQFQTVSSHVRDAMRRLFDSAQPHFAAWVWLYDTDRHWVDPMSKKHPTQPEAVPLYYASLCGFRDLVEHLVVTHPLDVNSRGGFHMTPLHAASAKGHSEVASVLVKNGANPDDRDNVGRAPLHSISRGGHLVDVGSLFKVARLLIDSGANVNVVTEQGLTPLHAAARMGYRDIARLLLDSGANLDARDGSGMTPLHMACRSGKLEVSRTLIDRGSDLNSRNSLGVTPLRSATRYGHLDVTQLLLDRGADINIASTKGWTALHRASQFGHLEVTWLLLDHGAEVNTQNVDRWTPLHSAAAGGHCEAAKLLIQHGANVDSRDNKEETPLHKASESGYLDTTRSLIEHGAGVSSRGREGWTPFHAALENRHMHVAKFLLECGVDVDIRTGNEETSLDLASGSGKLDIVRFLIEQGADVHARNKKGWAPLHTALNGGHLHIARCLLECGVDVDSRNGNQERSLDLAARSGKLEVVRFLIEEGADMDSRNNKGQTPFHAALKSGHLLIAKFLLECGVDVNIRSENEETSLGLASSSGRLDAVRFLIEAGADIHARNSKCQHPLHIASQNGCLDIVRLLNDAGAAVDIRNETQKTPLALASSRGNVEVSRFLIERGADINARDNKTCAPIHLASRHGHLNMTRLLLECGVDANAQKEDLWSPLHLASANGHSKVGQLLIQHGARVDILNDEQQTPLDRAAGNGNVEIACLLIDHGANLHAIDRNGWTPLHTACQAGHLNVVKLLLERGADVDVLDKARKTPAELSENNNAEVSNFLVEYKEDASSTTLNIAQHDLDKDWKDEGWVSLHTASEEGNLDVVKSRLDQGAKINAENKYDRTPLHLAAMKGNLDVVRLLVERGANVGSLDMFRWTPLHFASRLGHLQVSQVLLDHGADVNARNHNHWTPVHHSASNGYLTVVELLLERGADIHMLNDDGETPYQLSLGAGYRKIADLLWEHSVRGVYDA